MNPVQHLLNTTLSSTTVLCTLSLCVAICCGLVCEWRVEVSMRGMAAPGDVLVAAFFPIHDHIHYTRHSLREPPGFHTCIDFNPRALRWALAMEFALREVNMNRVLLPNTTLGHIIHDSCYDRSRTIKALLQLTGWGQASMRCRPHAVIGESGSTLSMEMARFLGHFHIPQISYFASCRCLSDKERFPSFLRSIPSDEHQSAAMASLVKHFHWGFVGTLEKDGEYGRNGVAGFLDVALSQGLCLAFREILPPLKDQKKFSQQGRFLSQTNAQVIVVFSPEAEFLPLVEQLLLQNVSGRTWMASEAWSTSRFLASSRFALVFTGTIGLALRQGTISGLSDFLKALRPRFLNRKNWTLAEGSEQIIKNLTRLCDGCTTNIMPPRNNCLFFPDMCSGDQDEVTYMTFVQMHMDDARRTRQKEADSSVFSLLSFKTMTNSLNPMDKHVLEQNTLSINSSGLQKMYRPFLYSTNPTTNVAGVESETYRTTQTRLRLVPLQNNNTFRVKSNDRSHSELHGSVTSVVEGLRDDDLNEFLMELWHLAFGCTWRNELGVTTCTGLEDLAESGVTIMDVSHLRVTYNVYMAVYFIAHALDDLSTCVQGSGPFKNSSCVSLSDFQPWQVTVTEELASIFRDEHCVMGTIEEYVCRKQNWIHVQQKPLVH